MSEKKEEEKPIQKRIKSNPAVKKEDAKLAETIKNAKTILRGKDVKNQ